jgi:hypothetical protein
MGKADFPSKAKAAVSGVTRKVSVGPSSTHGLAPESEPPEEKEEAQAEGKEAAVSGIEIGWILPAPRRLRGTWPEVAGEGHGSSNLPSRGGLAKEIRSRSKLAAVSSLLEGQLQAFE